MPKLITAADNHLLTKSPTLEEVKTAFFSMDSNKTPRLDGFGVGFFKTYWTALKGDLFGSVAEFVRDGKSLKEFNHTFIARIPKISSPSSTGHFRPISLYSTIYKIIFKIMANRLRPLLERIVSPF